jgi:hypothetical protein
MVLSYNGNFRIVSNFDSNVCNNEDVAEFSNFIHTELASLTTSTNFKKNEAWCGKINENIV